MKRRLSYICLVIFVVSLAVCGTSLAQRAMENTEEFQEKVEQQVEDASLRQPSGGEGYIEWQDDASSGSQQSGESQR